AITVLASGFLNPAVNSNGPAFGLWVALASGGELIPLPQIPLSVTDFNSSKISIYPNPTSSQLNLDIPFDYENFKGIIYDLSGREVKTFSNPNSIYVSDLNYGLYILNVTLDEVNFNQKFLKN
ncbi:MAG TPA: T9SS type A sorting domain-containing protein, partial [Flavobacterium sp.]|nr:T9SS type A sorting domain-containing protein [Flavobacterium sp.]